MRRLLLLLTLFATALAASDITTTDLSAGPLVWVTDMLYHGAYPVTYPATIQPGDTGVWLDIEMTNYFTMQYYNISTWLEVAGPFEGITTSTEIASADPMERVHAFYQLNVDDDAKPGEYQMRHHLVYYYDTYDKDGNKASTKVDRIRTVSVSVYYAERIEMKGIKVDPAEVLPGKEFTVTATLENTGSVTVNDIDVSYNVTTDPTSVNLMPLTTTTQRIASIKPGQSADASFPLKALDRATVKAYMIELTADYTSGSGTSTVTDKVGIDVLGKPDLRLAGAQVDKNTIYPDQQFSLSVQLENIGTGSAKSVKTALGDHTVNGVLTSYIGTIDVDDTGSAIFDLRDSAPGAKKITALVTYEDVYGNSYSRAIDAEYFVTARPADYATPVIAVVVLAAAIFLVWRSQQKKKRIEQLVK